MAFPPGSSIHTLCTRCAWLSYGRSGRDQPGWCPEPDTDVALCVQGAARDGGTLSDQTSRPKYQQVADDLRRSIAAGTYPVGAELPSTSQLTARYSASTTVVRAAIRELRTEGLVVGQPGKAVYVQAVPDGDTTAPDPGGVEQRL